MKIFVYHARCSNTYARPHLKYSGSMYTSGHFDSKNLISNKITNKILSIKYIRICYVDFVKSTILQNRHNKMSILLNQHTNLTLLIDKPFKLSIASDCYHNILIHFSLVLTVYCKYFKPKYINVLIV